MSDEERISATLRIAAPAAAIFAIVSDPAGQVAIDGSHMLVAAPDAARLGAVGDSFSMDMDRDALGDLPLGKYQVLNTVTKFEQDRLLEWNVGSAERGPLGHVYGYALEPVDEDVTDVTSYCDWSGISDAMRERIAHWPIVPKMALITTLDKLSALATTTSS
ncbi:MAG: polyketide cyclase [Ilumatobacteraceae bacterium]